MTTDRIGRQRAHRPVQTLSGTTTMATPAADHIASGHAGHSSPRSHGLGSLRAKMDKLSTGISRLGVAVTTTLNPNHRHDEEWEKEVDAKME